MSDASTVESELSIVGEIGSIGFPIRSDPQGLVTEAAPVMSAMLCMTRLSSVASVLWTTVISP